MKRKYRKRRSGEAMAEAVRLHDMQMAPMPADFRPRFTVEGNMLVAEWRGAKIGTRLDAEHDLAVNIIHAMKLSLWQAHEAYRMGHRE